MECRIVRNMLSEYIDDELTQEQKEGVNLHLGECEACQNELKELLAVHKLFAATERFTAPHGFSARVMAHVEERRESIWSSFFARPVFLKAVEVAFALIIVIIGFISGNALTSHRPPESASTSAEIRQSFALDAFEAAPSGSIGSIYVSMTGVRNE